MTLTVEDDAGGGVEFGLEGAAFAFHGKVVRHDDDDGMITRYDTITYGS